MGDKIMTYSFDASDWHFSGIQEHEIASIFSCITEDRNEIPEKESLYINKDNKGYYLDGLINNGKEIMLEPLKILQPQSFHVLEEFSSNYKIGFRWFSLIPAPHLPKDRLDIRGFFIVKGRVIFVNQSRYDFLEEASPNDESMSCLPEVIVNSWLKRAGGWAINTMPFPWLDSRQLIMHPHNSWKPIDTVLASFNDTWHQTTIMDNLKEKVPNLYSTRPTQKEDDTAHEWCSMRCFLDTRPYGLDGNCGDQFFVVDSRTDKVVYHIHNGDVENLRVLIPDAVGEAMDEYCAHTLLRTKGRFDFLPYSQIL